MPVKKRNRLDKAQAQIVIVGSGLAGLSAAISLEQAGFSNIALYERDENFQVQKEGYGLTLTYNPKGPLASLGVLEQVAQLDCPSRSHYLFRPDGSIFGYFGNAFFAHRGLGQRGNLRVPRKVLRRILFQTLKTTSIHWNHRLVDYTWNTETNQYTVDFQTGASDNSSQTSRTVSADLLVAADGIRSAVLQKLYRWPKPLEPQQNNKVPTMDEEKKDDPSPSKSLANGLHYMGVRLILGIADFTHPLLNERGFYTLDGKHRLFTMPYQSSQGLDDDTHQPTNKKRIMWQLSFATEHAEAPLDAASLLDHVLQTCREWHAPVFDMIQATPLETVWGTDLMDRDPKQVLELIQGQEVKRLVVVGDALHSMSPFKGQGANQALTDGPLLANWLQRSSIDSAVTGFWREIVQRTAPVVAASRQAAEALHSPGAVLQQHGFAGVETESIGEFLSTLQERGIGANLGAALDGRVRNLIGERQVAAQEPVRLGLSVDQQAQALELAGSGDTPGLRRLSLAKHSECIRTAKDSRSRSCLHLAAQGGHGATCKWLLTEVGCDFQAVDQYGKTPLDYAIENSGDYILAIFQTIEAENAKCQQ